jgi:DNA-directed RNA polymerase subunit RPC12/RpoP
MDDLIKLCPYCGEDSLEDASPLSHICINCGSSVPIDDY